MSYKEEQGLDKQFNAEEIEIRCDKFWSENEIYKYDSTQSRDNSFVIDTPPPTVSGSLHIGHIFSYTQTDIIARYQRMLGKSVFYPIGWDDNGLPTERRVQNYYNIACNPKVAYDQNFKPVHIENSKEERKEIYAMALDKVMELAVEFPTYQRNDLVVYNNKVIDETTLNAKPSANEGVYDRLWEVNYN